MFVKLLNENDVEFLIQDSNIDVVYEIKSNNMKEYLDAYGTYGSAKCIIKTKAKSEIFTKSSINELMEMLNFVPGEKNENS